MTGETFRGVFTIPSTPFAEDLEIGWDGESIQYGTPTWIQNKS